MQPDAIRPVRSELEGEPILLWFVTRWGTEALEVVFRSDEQDGQPRSRSCD